MTFGQLPLFVTSSAVFDPATLALTLWLKDYAGTSTWSGTASAGSSGSNSIASFLASTPGTTTLNGLSIMDTSGIYGIYSGTTDTYFSSAAGTCCALFNADTAAAPNTNAYQDACFFLDRSGNANVALGFSSSGVRVGLNTGADQTGHVTAGTGTWHFVQARWDATDLEVRLNGGTWTTVSSSGGIGTALTGSFYSITNFALDAFFDGKLAQLFAADTKLSDTNLNGIRSYLNSYYALSL
jgi:hypothetical protein